MCFVIMYFVLVKFMLNLFALHYFCIDSKASLVYVVIESMLSDSQTSNVSSTYMCMEESCLMYSNKSFTYKIKIKGPKIEPWTMP